ncbi:MAG: iduronate sulfatase, partial [Planctomycetota bacterium]
VKEDPHEWENLASEPQYAGVMERLRKYAPAKLAEPEPKLNARRDLVIEGETFRWEKGNGNYIPHAKYLPYTDPELKQKQAIKRR